MLTKGCYRKNTYMYVSINVITSTNNNINFRSYLKNPPKNRLKFTHITEEDSIKAIDNLEYIYSSGHDGISNKL